MLLPSWSFQDKTSVCSCGGRVSCQGCTGAAGVAAHKPAPFCGNCDSALYVSITSRSRTNNSDKYIDSHQTPRLAQTTGQDRCETFRRRTSPSSQPWSPLPASTYIGTQTGEGDMSAASWMCVSQMYYQEMCTKLVPSRHWYKSGMI